MFNYLCLIISFVSFTLAQTPGLPCIAENQGQRPGAFVALRKCTSMQKFYRGYAQSTLICCPHRISTLICTEYKELYSDSPCLSAKSKSSRQQVSRISSRAVFRPAVVGGRDVEPSEYPHMVALKYDDEEYGLDSIDSYKCGGTLISDEFVLTAAHCVTSSVGIPKFALIGATYLMPPRSSRNPNRMEIAIKQIIAHPNYNPPVVYNDIALIKLAKPVKFSANIRPACLSALDRGESVAPGSLVAAGWGRTENFGDASNVLQAVNLSLVNSWQCNAQYPPSRDTLRRLPSGILNTQMCAGGSYGKELDTCTGDSGGPLTVNIEEKYPCVHYAVGITSFGQSYCGEGAAVYTRVSEYLNWIEKNVWPETE